MVLVMEYGGADEQFLLPISAYGLYFVFRELRLIAAIVIHQLHAFESYVDSFGLIKNRNHGNALISTVSTQSPQSIQYHIT